MDKLPTFYPKAQAVVLVVDDDPDNLELVYEQVSLLLECSILTASDGNSALSLAKEFTPDLILLDIYLPGIDGFQVMQALKADARTKQIPVIAVTAAAKVQADAASTQPNFDDYVRKPYDIEALEVVIQRHLKPTLALVTEAVAGSIAIKNEGIWCGI